MSVKRPDYGKAGKLLQLNSAAEAAKQLHKQINGINHENQFF
jgi:hypothetical protein